MRASVIHRGRTAGGLAAILMLVATTTAIAAGSPVRVQAVAASQRLAVLNQDTQAFVKPSRNSRSAGVVNEVRPITGERTILPVVARTNAHGEQWLEVLLPGRPNSHTGWIEANIVTSTLTGWHIVIHLSTRQVVIFKDGHVARTIRAVIGKPATPTPTGNFFVEETVHLGPTASGAPFALALSARSNALAVFDGGPGQVAIHGIANIGGSPGTAVSHGCVRLTTAGITWLADHISSGVPVTIAS